MRHVALLYWIKHQQGNTLVPQCADRPVAPCNRGQCMSRWPLCACPGSLPLPLRGQRVSGGHFRFRPTPSLTGALPFGKGYALRRHSRARGREVRVREH